jgi:prepilin-type N-terminal cleavage/methylation domain-containing protein
MISAMRTRRRVATGSRTRAFRARTRAGFTLVEVVVAGLILALLAAITIPQVMDALDKKRIQDTVDLLQEIQYGFTNSDQTGFLNVVRTGATVSSSSVAPGLLSELVTPIVSNTATIPNSCNQTFQTTTAASTWASYGPFLERAVSTVDGLRTPIGNIQNTLSRTLAVQGTWTQAVFLKLQINQVDSVDAVSLDKAMDGVVGATAGAIQYTFASGIATVTFLIPIVNRC